MRAFIIAGIALIVLAGAHAVRAFDGTWPGAVLAQSAPLGQNRASGFVQKTPATAPDVWIGVRLTPLPDALAAHVGAGGLMIGNVAKDSPADTAGLERYDIIRALNGQKIIEMGELLSAIEQLGAGRAGELVVVRGGREITLQITPTRRPDTPTYAFKYEEPETAQVDDTVRYFGHRLSRDAQGNWMFEPLGRLNEQKLPLQLDLKELDVPSWRGQIEDWKDLAGNPFSFRVEVDPDNPDAKFFFVPDAQGDANTQVQIQIAVTEDGQTIEVQRNPDGLFTVRRKAADGTESIATFDNADEFQKGDEEAYRVYRRFSGYRQRPWIEQMPAGSSLRDMQQDFQRSVEESVRKAREQAARAREQAERLRAQVEKGLQGGRGTSGADVSFGEQTLKVVVEDDGRVHLTVTRGGKTESYEFESRDDFRRREPDLFERVKIMLEDQGAESSERSAVAVALA